MKPLLNMVKRYWAVLGIVASVLANVAIAAYAVGQAKGGGAVEFSQLKASVDANCVDDSKAHTSFGNRITVIEQRTDQTPEQLRDIQSRLGVLEGKTDTILRLLDKRVANAD